MDSEEFLVITFPSTHAALKAERTLAAAELKATMIPVPRWIMADCGIALRFSTRLRPEVEEALAEAGAAFKGIYEEID